MNSRESIQPDMAPDALDGVIRWALHDSVAGAEPSSQGWERLKQQIAKESVKPQPRSLGLTERISRAWAFSWLGPSIALSLPLSGRHTNELVHTMRIVEGKMPLLRLVS